MVGDRLHLIPGGSTMLGRAQTTRRLPDGAKDGDSPGDAKSSVLNFMADMFYYVSPAIAVAGLETQRPPQRNQKKAGDCLESNTSYRAPQMHYIGSFQR